MITIVDWPQTQPSNGVIKGEKWNSENFVQRKVFKKLFYTPYVYFPSPIRKYSQETNWRLNHLTKRLIFTNYIWIYVMYNITIWHSFPHPSVWLGHRRVSKPPQLSSTELGFLFSVVRYRYWWWVWFSSRLFFYSIFGENIPAPKSPA